jgi:hypothetical protein
MTGERKIGFSTAPHVSGRERAAWASGAEFVCAPSLDQKIARQLLAALICLGWAHAACCWLRADVFCTSGIARRSKLYTAAAAAPAARSLLLCLLVCAVRELHSLSCRALKYDADGGVLLLYLFMCKVCFTPCLMEKWSCRGARDFAANCGTFTINATAGTHILHSSLLK